MEESTERIQWHSGFYGAAELELREDKDILEFIQEYSLTKKPLSIDFMVIKKRTDAVIHNEIGRIFKALNLLKYKSPEHGINNKTF
jgi:hypothetical protein